MSACDWADRLAMAVKARADGGATIDWSRCCCTLVLVCCTLWCLVACGSTPRASSADAGGSESSLELTMDWRDADQARFARYVIETDGTIAFGGGFDASGGRTTWSGPLESEDRAAIWTLLREDGWLERTVEGTGEPRSVGATVRVQWDGGDRRHRVRGESAETDRLREVLDHASRGRFESTMRSLPQAGDRAR